MCQKLIEIMKKTYDSSDIFLIQSRYHYYKGRNKKETQFESWKEISEKNKIIQKRERYFMEHFPGINVISVEDETRFSSILNPYGCSPYYGNPIQYIRLADKIYDSLYEKM